MQSTSNSSGRPDNGEQRKRGTVGANGDGDGNKKIKFNTTMIAPKGE